MKSESILSFSDQSHRPERVTECFSATADLSPAEISLR